MVTAFFAGGNFNCRQQGILIVADQYVNEAGHCDPASHAHTTTGAGRANSAQVPATLTSTGLRRCRNCVTAC